MLFLYYYVGNSTSLYLLDLWNVGEGPLGFGDAHCQFTAPFVREGEPSHLAGVFTAEGESTTKKTNRTLVTSAASKRALRFNGLNEGCTKRITCPLQRKQPMKNNKAISTTKRKASPGSTKAAPGKKTHYQIALEQFLEEFESRMDAESIPEPKRKVMRRLVKKVSGLINRAVIAVLEHTSLDRDGGEFAGQMVVDIAQHFRDYGEEYEASLDTGKA